MEILNFRRIYMWNSKIRRSFFAGPPQQYPYIPSSHLPCNRLNWHKPLHITTATSSLQGGAYWRRLTLFLSYLLSATIIYRHKAARFWKEILGLTQLCRRKLLAQIFHQQRLTSWTIWLLCCNEYQGFLVRFYFQFQGRHSKCNILN